MSPPSGFGVAAFVVVVLAKLTGQRIEVHGLEHVPRRGGAVLTWNHTSHVDMVLTAIPIWQRLRRPLRFLAVRELWRARAFRWLLELADVVPVERGSTAARRGALGHAVAAAAAGDLVVMAPEGTISASFELLPFRPGAAVVARDAGVPIVPSASWGSHLVSTTGHPPRWSRSLGVTTVVCFGAPLHVGPDADPRAVTARLREETDRLRAAAIAAHPDGLPDGAWWVPAELGGSAPPHPQVLARHRPNRPLTPSPWADGEHAG